MNEEIESVSFNQDLYDKLFTEFQLMDNEDAYELIKDYSLQLAIIDIADLGLIYLKMDNPSVLIITSLPNTSDFQFLKKGGYSIRLPLKNMCICLKPEELGFKINLNKKQDERLLGVVTNNFDTTDYIYIGTLKRELFQLYCYLLKLNYKVLMPIDDIQLMQTIRKYSKADIFYNAENFYSPQQKLF